MAITQTTKIDIIVYIVIDAHMETIKFQQNKWNENILPELTKFYFEFMQKNIFNNI